MTVSTTRAPIPIKFNPDGLVAAPAPDAARRLRFLLVDDEPRLLSSLVALLQERDYELVTATCLGE